MSGWVGDREGGWVVGGTAGSDLGDPGRATVRTCQVNLVGEKLSVSILLLITWSRSQILGRFGPRKSMHTQDGTFAVPTVRRLPEPISLTGMI